MNGYQIALLFGAAITMLISLNLERAALWIILGIADFAASTAYARYGLPYPPFFTMMCDALLCLAVFFLATRQWEKWLYHIFQGSVLVSLCYLVVRIVSGGAAGATAQHYWYITGLEILNWVALLLIGSTAIIQRVGEHGGGLDRNWDHSVFGADSAFRSPRKDQPFHRQK